MLADCCLSLEDANDKTSYPQSWHFYETEVSYQNDSYYHFILESELIFDTNLPRYRMKKRVSDYVTYFDEEAEVWK